MTNHAYTRVSLPNDPGFVSGDPCPEKGCQGSLKIAETRRGGGWVIRPLKCNVCGKRPGKIIRADDKGH